MRCEETQIRLATYALGELAPEERRQVYAHLRECAVCQAALARTDWLAAALMKADAPAVPAGLRERVMEAARTRRRAKIAAGWNPFKWWRMATAPMHAAAAVVLVVGLTVGLLMGWTFAPLRAKTTTIAQQDPLDAYRLDYLGDAPAGSLADSYLTLVVAANEGGR